MSDVVLGPLFVRFPVDAVEEASRAIWCEPLLQHVPKRFRKKLIVAAEPERRLINSSHDLEVENGLFPSQVEQHPTESYLPACDSNHPLIDAVHIAFARHYPLQLSPDTIWLVLAQGFGHHVLENAEALRGRIVRHPGKMELHAKVFDLSPEGLASMVQTFSQEIREYSDPVLHETLLCDFSTTTPHVRTASEVVMMDSFQDYFQYSASCVCGIPRVTLTGTVEDWERIRARVEVLATYELAWWVARLRPILDKFVETAKGRPNRRFWQAIYKPESEYFKDVTSGWIADLFPYLGDRPKRRRNFVFERKRRDWLLGGLGPDTGSFPSGLCGVPVNFSSVEGPPCAHDLIAGFMGVEQLPDLAITPVISWALAEPGVTRRKRG